MARLVAVLIGITMFAAACGGGSSAEDTQAGSADVAGASQDIPSSTVDYGDAPAECVEQGSKGIIASPLVDSTPAEEHFLFAVRMKRMPECLAIDHFPSPTIDVTKIRSGGPPPEGIPAIDRPVFAPIGEIEFLSDREPVMVVTLDGETKAYPAQILMWHELVNDTVANKPVTVSFCPLCNSAIAYNRILGNRILDFGTSGSLFNSALVMYDRQTGSLWSHFTGEAVAGALAGERLELLPMSTVSYADFKSAHPDGVVLTTDTGWVRQYGVNPYVAYDTESSSPYFPVEGDDDRLQAKTRVIGVRGETDAVAVSLATLWQNGTVQLDLEGRPIVVWVKPGTASSLNTALISEGTDIGATGVFVAEADGQSLTFTVDGDEFVDDQTGSRWNVLGNAVSGRLEGTSLEPVEHVDTFWFAWVAFQPDALLFEG